MVHSGGASGGHYYAYIKYAFIVFSQLMPCHSLCTVAVIHLYQLLISL